MGLARSTGRVMPRKQIVHAMKSPSPQGNTLSALKMVSAGKINVTLLIIIIILFKLRKVLNWLATKWLNSQWLILCSCISIIKPPSLLTGCKDTNVLQIMTVAVVAACCQEGRLPHWRCKLGDKFYQALRSHSRYFCQQKGYATGDCQGTTGWDCQCMSLKDDGEFGMHWFECHCVRQGAYQITWFFGLLPISDKLVMAENELVDYDITPRSGGIGEDVWKPPFLPGRTHFTTY